jgi:hypothetical protein
MDAEPYLTLNQQVEGSIPSALTTLFSHLSGLPVSANPCMYQ